MRNYKLWLSILVIGAWASCKSKKEEKLPDTEYLVTSALVKDTAVTIEYVCQIHAIQHIELRNMESGYLQNIYVGEGDMVSKGQKLFQIKPIVYKAENQRAQAEVNYAKVEYNTTKSLADSNVVSQNELALARAKLAKAHAELELTQAHLGFTVITAPFSGIIDRFHVRIGSLMDEGDLLTSLSDNSQMWVYFNLPESSYLNYKTNSGNTDLNQVGLRMANGNIFPYQGKITAIEADFNNETGNIAFRATFDNPQRLLRHGETGNVIVREPYVNTIVIPQKATFEVLDRKYVYVVDQKNVVHTREIKVAAELDDIYLLSSGLKPGEKILLEGLRKVQDGDKIKFKYEDPNQVILHLKNPTE